MRWRTEEKRRKDHNLTLTAKGWHTKFLWRPVRIGGHWHWLTRVQVRYHINPHRLDRAWPEYKV